MPTDAEMTLAAGLLMDALIAMQREDEQGVLDALNASEHLTPCVVALTAARIVAEALPPHDGHVLVCEPFQVGDSTDAQTDSAHLAAAVLAAVANGDIAGAHRAIHTSSDEVATMVAGDMLQMAAVVTAP